MNGFCFFRSCRDARGAAAAGPLASDGGEARLASAATRMRGSRAGGRGGGRAGVLGRRVCLGGRAICGVAWMGACGV